MPLALLVGVMLLAACQRSFSAPGAVLPEAQNTPTASLTTDPEKGASTRAQDPTAVNIASPTAATATPDATPTLSAGLARALDFFPLQTGNSWIYTFRHTNKQTGASGTSLVTDTVVETRREGGYHAAHMRREVLLQEGKPAGTVWDTSADFWIILSEDEVYRQPGSLDLSALAQNATLELRMPLPQPACWDTAPEQRRGTPAPEKQGCRLAEPVGAVTVPAGDFYNCYRLSETTPEGELRQTFCPGTGWVNASALGSGENSGYSLELSGYLRQ